MMDSTPWDKYGAGKNPKCEGCMAHCGYEATAVSDTLAHPLKALGAAIRGPKVDGPMVEAPSYKGSSLSGIPVTVDSRSA
jgi:hypothetical protein